MKTSKFLLASLLTLVVAGASAQVTGQNRGTAERENGPAGVPFVKMVGGTVTDADTGIPITGVAVRRAGSSDEAVLTGTTGRYNIAAKVGDKLEFTYPGYETLLVEVERPTHNVQLTPVREQLLECVVAGVSGSVAGLPGGDTRLFSGGINAAGFDYDALDAEQYARIRENRFVNVSKEPLSTFALEVDGASYSNVRRMINRGVLPTPDAVRVEEFVNYFSYGYEAPRGKEPLKVDYQVGECPWNRQHRLVAIGIKAREIPSEGLPEANFVFLIDVSGSMHSRLPLVVASMKLLVNNLRPEDRVAIVTYAGSDRLALPSTSGGDRQKIREVLDGLTSGGGTAGAAGLSTAYKVARENFIAGGNNRIILATDGDFNVGQTSDEAMEALVERERKSGVYLTVLGYGMGNYKDKKMQVLAEKGNGNHACIDNLQEANRVLATEFGSTMYTVAGDVKLQVEFNPARVSAFRLVGYESRLLEHEDFNDEGKDAGEIGAGHTVTALYEIVPVGSKSGAGSIDPLKYRSKVERQGKSSHHDELMTVKIRYKEPGGGASSRIELPVTDSGSEPSADFHFAAAVAMFAQLLRDSDFKGGATYEMVVEQALKGLGDDPRGYRREFVRLVEAAGLAAAEK